MLANFEIFYQKLLSKAAQSGHDACLGPFSSKSFIHPSVFPLNFQMQTPTYLHTGGVGRGYEAPYFARTLLLHKVLRLMSRDPLWPPEMKWTYLAGLYH